MSSIITKNIPYIIVFLLNAITTYFAISLVHFSFSQGLGYVLFIIAVFISHICFTIFPKPKRSISLMTFLNVFLHALVSYLLLVVFSNIF
jgi:hypothetical protein